LDASPQARSLDWLPVPSDSVRFVFTAHDGSPVLKTLDRRGCERARLHPLGREERLLLVHEVLKKAYGKSIDPDLARRIAGDDESANTLVLRSLLDELAAHGRNATLAARVNHYLKAKSYDRFFELVLARFENDFGRDTTERLLAPLAFSRSGLQEDELLAISGLTQLQWSQFYCAFMPYLTRCRGLLGFSNRYVRDAARTRYAAAEADSRSHIAALFAGRTDARACHELPWQLHATARHHELYAFLLDFEVLAQLCDTDDVQLALYWRRLTARDKEAFTPAAYLGMPCEDSEAHIRLLGFLGHLAVDHLTDGPLASRFLDKALTMAINLYGADSIEAAAAHNNKGCMLHSLGESERALQHHLHALRIYESAERNYDVEIAATHNNIGLASAADEGHSRRHFEKALALLDGGERRYSYFQATVCNNLANALRDEGIHDRAIQLYERALAELERAKGPDHTVAASIKNNMGRLYNAAGDTAAAMETHFEALRIYKATYGDCHPDVAVTLSHLGALCRQAGQSGEALRYLHEALRIFIATCGERHHETARCCHNLGVIYADAGRMAEAMQFLSKAFDLR
ncbi:MAG: tetratricopeptide repeat protein, partial [Muribaculaceae bacterium]|nr:tetratricopeptide repeat protein [Muribaculaceae bacterium]